MRRVRSFVVAAALLISATATAQEAPDPALRGYGIAGAVGRIAIGIGPIVSPALAFRTLGLPDEQSNPTSILMSRLFGVRDIGLGALVLASLHDRTALRRSFLFNMCIDAGDALMFAIPLLRRDDIGSGGVRGMAFALGGELFWSAGFVWGGHRGEARSSEARQGSMFAMTRLRSGSLPTK